MTSSVLITGGTGFLGRGLARSLLDSGHERVCSYSRGEHTQASMRQEFNDERLRFFVGDVRDLDRIERAMAGVEVVIHAAALKRIEVGHLNPDEMVKTNVTGTLNVIEAARRTRVKRVILVSSDKAFEPISPYGLTKALAEHLCLSANRMNLGPKFVVCRYGNVSGSTGSVIPLWRGYIARGEVVPITDPECTRFWMHLSEAVALVRSAMVGDKEVLIPILPAYRLVELAIAMGAKDTKITGLASWEKKHESMADGNSSKYARRLSLDELRELLRAVP